MKYRMLIMIIVVMVIAGCSSAVHKETTYNIRFGIVDASSNGVPKVVKETTQIPRRYKSTGFVYGVTISPADDQPYDIYFIAGLPSMPETFTGLAKDSTVNPATRKLKSATQRIKGTSTIPMWFDPGDPLGEYSLEVFINGQSRKLITYNVIE